MALYDVVQSGHADSSGDVTLTSVAAGNILVAAVRQVGSPTVSDDQGDTWVQRSASSDAQVWCAFNVTGGTTVISTDATSLTVMELVGDATVSFDAENNTVQVPGAFTNGPSGTVSIAQSVECLIGYCAIGGNPGAITENLSFVNVESWPDGAGSYNHLSRMVTSGTGSYQFDPSWVNGVIFTRSCIVALKATGGGGGSTLRPWTSLPTMGVM